MAHPLPVHEARHSTWLREGWPDAKPLAYTTSSEVRGFRAYPTRRHDGDSFWVMVDQGFDGRHEPELRLLDVHAPEVRGLAMPRMMQPGGRETTEYVNGWLKAVETRTSRRWCLWVETVLTRTFEPEQRQSFDRYLATVFDFERRAPELSLNASVATFLSGHPEWPGGE
jgi:hypothetical protein